MEIPRPRYHNGPSRLIIPRSSRFGKICSTVKPRASCTHMSGRRSRFSISSSVRSLKAARVNIVVRKFASERRSIRSSAQQLYARHVYSWRDIRWQHRYKDITSVSSQGRSLLDYTKFHDTVSEE